MSTYKQLNVLPRVKCLLLRQHHVPSLLSRPGLKSGPADRNIGREDRGRRPSEDPGRRGRGTLYLRSHTGRIPNRPWA